ncbi:50S ribosomal protein L17 [Patescibacteria group bacterium]
MRHRKKRTILSRKRNSRDALLKGLVRSLILKGHITTTQARAKAIRPIIERFITLAKKPSLHHRRLLIQRSGSRQIAEKLLSDIANRYKDRKGGYVRILLLGPRKGDSAQVARIEFI